MTGQPEALPVYLASIALEPNRWKRAEKRVPSLKISEWSDRAAEAGFTGWELWEDHFFKASEAEREALRDSRLPVRVFNTYLRPGTDPEADWDQVVEAVSFLGSQVEGIKFNLGKEAVPFDDQVEAAMDWGSRLPAGVRMLCECHPGTILETPPAAAKAFAIWPADRFSGVLHPMADRPGHCADWFNALPGRITHLHWQARNAENRMCLLSTLEDRLSVVKTSLQEFAYRGTQSIEFVEGTGRPEETPERSFEAAVADLATIQGLQRG